jgi:hypothetical protein
MKLKYLGAAVLLLIGGAAGCASEDATQTVEPEARGQRGETCMARNDCSEGLACISGVCSKNDFDVLVSAKHCDQIDCSADADCCGGKPLEAPAKCANRDVICNTPSLPNCVSASCTSDGTCGDGTCTPGTCATWGGSCTDAGDCTDTCVDMVCTKSLISCTLPTDCGGAYACSGRFCDCTNPLYDPFDPICSDPECVDVCTLRCRDERCVADTSCEADAECFPFGLTICNDGLCVECLENEDCNEDLGETCISNRCDKPCLQNEECPLFHACNQGTGECEPSGCTGDRECVLAAASGNLGTGEDARLAKCLPSGLGDGLNTCKVPCENDGSCGSEFQVCDGGYCVFIGCETDEECRSYLGLANQDSDLLPYVPKAVCRE